MDAAADEAWNRNHRIVDYENGNYRVRGDEKQVLIFASPARIILGVTRDTSTNGTGTDTRASDCPLNSDMVITGIDMDVRHGFRLEELGLRRGTVIRVVQRSAFGGRVLARGPERIAVDAGTARRIRVASGAPRTAVRAPWACATGVRG